MARENKTQSGWDHTTGVWRPGSSRVPRRIDRHEAHQIEQHDHRLDRQLRRALVPRVPGQRIRRRRRPESELGSLRQRRPQPAPAGVLRM